MIPASSASGKGVAKNEPETFNQGGMRHGSHNLETFMGHKIPVLEGRNG